MIPAKDVNECEFGFRKGNICNILLTNAQVKSIAIRKCQSYLDEVELMGRANRNCPPKRECMEKESVTAAGILVENTVVRFFHS